MVRLRHAKGSGSLASVVILAMQVAQPHPGPCGAGEEQAMASNTIGGQVVEKEPGRGVPGMLASVPRRRPDRKKRVWLACLFILIRRA